MRIILVISDETINANTMNIKYETHVRFVKVRMCLENFKVQVIVVTIHNKTYLNSGKLKSYTCVILIIEVLKYSKLCYVSCIGSSEEKAVRARYLGYQNLLMW